MKISDKYYKNARPTALEGSSLVLDMVEETIIVAALPSVEMLNGTESKFEAWMKAIENVT